MCLYLHIFADVCVDAYYPGACVGVCFAECRLSVFLLWILSARLRPALSVSQIILLTDVEIDVHTSDIHSSLHSLLKFV